MADGQGGGQEPRVIRNRDIPLLSRINGIMQDVCRLEERIAWQKDRAYNVTRQLTGMPVSHGGTNGLDATLAALDGLTDEYSEKVRQYMRELRAAERILNGIASETMRTFVVMMYVDNLPAASVRRELKMTEYGFMRAREAVERARDMKSVIWRERYILEKNS